MNTSQQKSIAKLARRISLTMLRFSSICVGSWLTAVVPVEVWADGRRIANAAADYMPNMDPGTVVVIAFFLTLPVLAVVLLIESMRWWACGHEPLTFSSCVTLGALARMPHWLLIRSCRGSARVSICFFCFHSQRWRVLHDKECLVTEPCKKNMEIVEMKPGATEPPQSVYANR